MVCVWLYGDSFMHVSIDHYTNCNIFKMTVCWQNTASICVNVVEGSWTGSATLCHILVIKGTIEVFLRSKYISSGCLTLILSNGVFIHCILLPMYMIRALKLDNISCLYLIQCVLTIYQTEKSKDKHVEMTTFGQFTRTSSKDSNSYLAYDTRHDVEYRKQSPCLFVDFNWVVSWIAMII
jgi:hypothetical protein